jgi:Ca2+-binding RTX toxin-like protein
MARRQPNRGRVERGTYREPQPQIGVEGLESRLVLAAGLGYDRASRVISIVGSVGNDSAEVRQQGANVVVSLTSAAGRLSRSVNAAQVSRVVFSGQAGNDTFTNLTAIATRADGGAGADVLRGGRGVDQLMGGDGNDQLFGDAGTDSLWGGLGNDELYGGAGTDALRGEKGNDQFDGGTGRDQLVGGDGLDMEVDTGDRFADGDTDGDGFDNDYDSMDILYESPGNPPAYADDATVAPIIAAVDGEVRNFLEISAADTGLRVRVQANQFGDRVTGVWRYLTPDKIQVWGKWAYPASDPSQVSLAVQWSYAGPYSGNPADYSNPANYVISEESRVYAGFLNGPTTFVNWLPGTPANFTYFAANEQATGFATPIEGLRTALASVPNFTNSGDSFSGDLSASPGLPGVQPVLDVLRTINRVTRASRPRPSPRP